MLSAQQQDRYQTDGTLVLPGFKPAPALAALRARAIEIVEAFDEHAHRDIFSTQDRARRSAGRNFLASAEGIACFFEQEAFDADGRLRQAKALSINKIGHALHDLDPVFEQFSCQPELQALAQGLGLAEPQLWQSMVIFKQPGIGGEVSRHQDARYFWHHPGHRHRLLVCAAGRHAGQRLPVGAAGRPPQPAARALRARRRAAADGQAQ